MIMSEPTQFGQPQSTPALRGELRLDEPMSRHTSWRAGGVAQRLYQPADLADLCDFLRGLPAAEPLLAVGLGSNLLVRDGGLRGTVLLMHGALRELSLQAEGSLYAQAGVPGAKLARFAALHGCLAACREGASSDARGAVARTYAGRIRDRLSERGAMQ